jgi:uncharacterized protein YdiU (UPF0061 family)
MAQELEAMWASKLGLTQYDADLVQQLLQLLVNARADYTLFFRRLSAIPETVEALKPSFYVPCSSELEAQLQAWLERWRRQLADPAAAAAAMERANPAITWREWLVAPAYEQAATGDTRLIQELQAVFRDPYAEPPAELASTYDRLRPREFFNAGGVSHYSCSS